MLKKKVLIRVAIGLDILQLVNIGKEYHEEAVAWSCFEYNSGQTALSLNYAIEDRDQQIFLAIADNKIVGFMWSALASYVFSKDKVAKDLYLYVKPAYRGENIGKRLTDEFEKWAKACNATAIITGANSGISDAADKLYTNSNYLPFGYNYLKLIKE